MDTLIPTITMETGAQGLWDNNDGQNEVLPLRLRFSRGHLLDAAHVTGMVSWGPGGRSAVRSSEWLCLTFSLWCTSVS